jgi:hypothetical protein
MSKKNYYMINMQKLLFVASELHKRGYEKLHVVPSVAPNGLAWRCNFVVNLGKKNQSIIVSNWIREFINDDDNEIKQSPQELSDLLEKENMDFLVKCRGENREYVEWFNEMLNKLKEGELPYAFDDQFWSTDFWKTTLDNKIEILPDENKYYD